MQKQPAHPSRFLLMATVMIGLAIVLIAAMPTTDQITSVEVTWVPPTQKIIYVQKPVIQTPTMTFTATLQSFAQTYAANADNTRVAVYTMKMTQAATTPTPHASATIDLP